MTICGMWTQSAMHLLCKQWCPPALVGCASVVDDNVSDGLEPMVVAHRNQVPQLRFTAIIGVQVVQVTRQVAL